MAPSVWKFVDRPETGATTLLDMRGSGWKVLGRDFDVSPPPLRRSIAQNAMTDGGVVTSTSADLRELKCTLELFGATEDARNAQLKALESELAKPSNLLMYQAEGSSFPVFFRTIRSDAFDLDNQYIPGVTWQVPLTILAEPYAIGTRHDIVSNLTVQNDPAAGTNRMFFDITGVRGDSSAPAFVRVGLGLAAGATFVIAQRTANNPTALTLFAQAESGTLGTDTTVQANDTTMSGTGSNFVRCAFTTNTLITRLTVTLPTATSAEALRGRYRVFVKVRRSASTSAFLMRYNIPGGNSILGQQVSYDTGLGNLWAVDLGTVDFPVFAAPSTMGYSSLPAAYATPTIEIQAQRTSGSLPLDVDYVYLMPANERQCTFRTAATVQYAVLDGPNDMTYGMPSGSSPFDAAVANRTVDNAGGLISRHGGMPMLVPGATNRWHVMRPTHNVNATSTYDVSYWPRWREVATS